MARDPESLTHYVFMSTILFNRRKSLYYTIFIEVCFSFSQCVPRGVLFHGLKRRWWLSALVSVLLRFGCGVTELQSATAAGSDPLSHRPWRDTNGKLAREQRLGCYRRQAPRLRRFNSSSNSISELLSPLDPLGMHSISTGYAPRLQRHRMRLLRIKSRNGV